MPDPQPALDEFRRNWKRRWLTWLAIYVAGFALIWAAGLAYDWPFYAWAIGWALVKSFWDEAAFRRGFHGYQHRRGDGEKQ